VRGAQVVIRFVKVVATGLRHLGPSDGVTGGLLDKMDSTLTAAAQAVGLRKKGCRFHLHDDVLLSHTTGTVGTHLRQPMDASDDTSQQEYVWGAGEVPPVLSSVPDMSLLAGVAERPAADWHQPAGGAVYGDALTMVTWSHSLTLRFTSSEIKAPELGFAVVPLRAALPVGCEQIVPELGKRSMKMEELNKLHHARKLRADPGGGLVSRAFEGVPISLNGVGNGTISGRIEIYHVLPNISSEAASAHANHHLIPTPSGSIIEQKAKGACYCCAGPEARARSQTLS
jgi:hypothetical protein